MPETNFIDYFDPKKVDIIDGGRRIRPLFKEEKIPLNRKKRR